MRSKGARAAASLAVLGVALGARFAGALGATSGTPVALPPAPGRELLLEACVQCHDLDPVTSQRKDAGAWRRTLNEMIWRGAPLLPGETEVLTAYLANAFGTTASPAAAPPRSAPADASPAPVLPPGPGRELVLKACVGCHDLATSVSPRKTVEEWHRSVDLMVRLGARLSAGEISVVADYLARSGSPSGSGTERKEGRP